jgi:hypothetical protein
MRLPSIRIAPKLLVCLWLAAGALWLAAGACSGSSNTTGTGLALSLSNRACSWPASLDDAGAGGCYAARAIIACTDPSGDGCFGLSNEANCSVCGDGYNDPMDKCGADQYGVVCGSTGTSSLGESIGAPPAGCTSQGATPGGTIYYCCPCS